jgi:hypothetical protein
VARWNGATWSAMGSGFTAPVKALLAQPNGDVVAGGDFTLAGGSPATGVARWQGSSWAPLGTFKGQAAALVLLPDGDVVAAGPSATQPAAHIARWNGSLWVPLAATGTNQYATSLTTLPSGDLVVGGGFSVAGGAVSASVADVTTSCPATAVATSGGCPSSGGANVLVATGLPWLGGTFRAQATGLPQQAIVVAVSSAQALVPGSTPLSALLPQGVPGCELRVSAELLDLVFTAGGAPQSLLLLPATTTLAGVVFHHQLIPCELDGSGAIVAITATNALQLTCGVF